MVLKYNFRGFMAPVFTAFTESQEINYNIVPRYANYLKQRGVLGILVNGTTGEGPSLDVNERKLLTEEWIKATRNTQQSLVVQVGGACLKEVLDLAVHAEKQRADALLCLPELYFKPKTIQELVQYLKFVSNAAPNTPLLYYHIPSFTDVNFDMEEFINVAVNEVPTFAGMKFTHTNLEEGGRCIQVANKHSLVIFLGADQLVLASTVVGFDSVIATSLNMWPELFQAIQSNVKDCKVQEAMDTQTLLTNRVNNIARLGSWVAALKAAMNQVSGLDMGKPRPPLVPMTPQQNEKISEIISC